MTTNRQDPGGAAIVGTPPLNAVGPGPEVMAASTLEGNEVYNSMGELLGSIEEVMLDVPHGRIAYAVMAHGGVLGIGERLYAIPWGALTLDIRRKCFLLDVSVERLQADKGFDKGNWPSMADENWARQTHDYYQQTPYW